MVQVLSDIVEVVVLTAGTDALLRVCGGGELGQSQGRVGGSQKKRLKLQAETKNRKTNRQETRQRGERQRKRRNANGVIGVRGHLGQQMIVKIL